MPHPTQPPTLHSTLEQHLVELQAQHGCAPELLCTLILALAQCCADISRTVEQGALAGVLGSAQSANVQGEEQKKLDIIANDMLLTALQSCGALAGMASEEMDDIYPIPDGCPTGPYLLLFDPLDGSSNIDVNVSIGTIFSILKKTTPAHQPVSTADFLQAGSQQVAAGYCVYGPQTTLVLSLGHGSTAFTLDPENKVFLRSISNLRIPNDSQEYAVNMSNQRHWATPMQRYIDECQAGQEGARGKNFNMRWVGSMVADVHRILCRGGIFAYPWDRREPSKPGKLRLLYEANPMAWLVEQAGGAANTGHGRILDIQPQQLHQRTSVFLGAKNEIDTLVRYHSEADAQAPVTTPA